MITDDFMNLKILRERTDNPIQVFNRLVDKTYREIVQVKTQTIHACHAGKRIIGRCEAMSSLLSGLCHHYGNSTVDEEQVSFHDCICVFAQLDFSARQFFAILDDIVVFLEILGEDAKRLRCNDLGGANDPVLADQHILGLEFGVQKLRDEFRPSTYTSHF